MNGGADPPTTSTSRHAASASLRELLSGAIDYAGLFPPSALDMETAVRNYVSYRESKDAPLLGRFVAPAARLSELAESVRAVAATRVRVSAVFGASVETELDAVTDFNARFARDLVVVDAIEAKADRPDVIYHLASRAASAFAVFIELPLESELELLVAAVRAAGLSAKIRTGGVTADAFPPARGVVHFMRTCLEAGVPFKATAGLHHPITGSYALTYAPNAPRGSMFGFLNVFLAAAFLAAALSEGDAARLLDERDAAAFSFDDRGVDWRGHHLDSAQLEATRARVFGSFGSCSFREPVDELRSMALL